MKIQYWVTGVLGNNIINFSVTGEGSIDVECEQDARSKVKESNPFIRNVNLQQVAIISK